MVVSCMNSIVQELVGEQCVILNGQVAMLKSLPYFLDIEKKVFSSVFSSI